MQFNPLWKYITATNQYHEGKRKEKWKGYPKMSQKCMQSISFRISIICAISNEIGKSNASYQ